MFTTHAQLYTFCRMLYNINDESRSSRKVPCLSNKRKCILDKRQNVEMKCYIKVQRHVDLICFWRSVKHDCAFESLASELLEDMNNKNKNNEDKNKFIFSLNKQQYNAV